MKSLFVFCVLGFVFSAGAAEPVSIDYRVLSKCFERLDGEISCLMGQPCESIKKVCKIFREHASQRLYELHFEGMKKSLNELAPPISDEIMFTDSKMSIVSRCLEHSSKDKALAHHCVQCTVDFGDSSSECVNFRKGLDVAITKANLKSDISLKNTQPVPAVDNRPQPQ